LKVNWLTPFTYVGKMRVPTRYLPEMNFADFAIRVLWSGGPPKESAMRAVPSPMVNVFQPKIAGRCEAVSSAKDVIMADNGILIEPDAHAYHGNQCIFLLKLSSIKWRILRISSGTHRHSNIPLVVDPHRVACLSSSR